MFQLINLFIYYYYFLSAFGRMENGCTLVKVAVVHDSFILTSWDGEIQHEHDVWWCFSAI